jgi:PqqD family protein of HPr-rel-A system
VRQDQRFRTAVGVSLRFSPPWGDEVAVFNPASTEILVVTPLAASVLRAVQAHAPAAIDDICSDLREQAREIGSEDLRAGVGALLIEFERLGLVESHAP